MSNSLGKKIRKHRMEKGYSFDKLAELTKSSKSYLWELENRDTRRPSASKLMKIAYALNVTTEFLLDDSKEVSDNNVRKDAFFLKFEKLTEGDQNKIMKIIEDWTETNE